MMGWRRQRPADVIQDHYRHPRNYGELAEPTDSRHGTNPLCGDEVTLSVRLDGERIGAVGFTARGCSIVQASASILTELVQRQSVTETQALGDLLERSLTTTDLAFGDHQPELAALVDVKMYPARIKCALLPWQTLAALLRSRSQDHLERHRIGR